MGGLLFDVVIVHGINVLHPISMNFTALIGTKQKGLIETKKSNLTEKVCFEKLGDGECSVAVGFDVFLVFSSHTTIPRADCFKTCAQHEECQRVSVAKNPTDYGGGCLLYKSGCKQEAKFGSGKKMETSRRWNVESRVLNEVDPLRW